MQYGLTLEQNIHRELRPPVVFAHTYQTRTTNWEPKKDNPCLIQTGKIGWFCIASIDTEEKQK